MESPPLHIVAFDNPYPPDYGGAVDLFYKIRALAGAGIRIHLHYFEYGRRDPGPLADWCTSVSVYPRVRRLRDVFSGTPFIVRTRPCAKIAEAIRHNPGPVLLEGLHCTDLLSRLDTGYTFPVWVRLHNIEWQYYKSLSRREIAPIRKWFFRAESVKLRRWEAKLSGAAGIWAISDTDQNYYRDLFPGKVKTLYPFNGSAGVTGKTGSGAYVLYQGDLGIRDNAHIASRLMSLWTDPALPQLVIAGKRPPAWLHRLQGAKHIRLVANPGQDELDHLMADAHIVLALSGVAAGMKLKLIHALFKGRHCLADAATLQGNGLGQLTSLLQAPGELKKMVQELMRSPFTEEQLKHRKEVLESYYTDTALAHLLRETIFTHDHTTKYHTT